MNKHKLLHFLGIGENPVSQLEKIISGIGGFVGILAVYYVSSIFIGHDSAVYIVPSMGASAVLLFAVPHSALGQLWSTIGGHLISAVIGVTCVKLFSTGLFSAAASVGLAIVAMYYIRCIHPPGGATALAAVIGGPEIHSLGYGYVLAPVGINLIVILLIAVLFNGFFKWRRYPAFLNASIPVGSVTEESSKYPAIEHADFVYALSQMDSFIDVSEEDLLIIYQLATQRKAPSDSDI